MEGVIRTPRPQSKYPYQEHFHHQLIELKATQPPAAKLLREIVLSSSL